MKAIGKEVDLQVTDVLGQVIYSGKTIIGTGAFKYSIDLDNNFANGVYMLRIVIDNESKVMRFTIKK